MTIKSEGAGPVKVDRSLTLTILDPSLSFPFFPLAVLSFVFLVVFFRYFPSFRIASLPFLFLSLSLSFSLSLSLSRSISSCPVVSYFFSFFLSLFLYSPSSSSPASSSSSSWSFLPRHQPGSPKSP